MSLHSAAAIRSANRYVTKNPQSLLPPTTTPLLPALAISSSTMLTRSVSPPPPRAPSPPLAQTALSPPRRRSAAPRAPFSQLPIDTPIPPRLLASPLIHDALLHHQAKQHAKPTPRPAFSWLDQNEFSVPPTKPRAPPSPPASIKSTTHRHKRTVSRVDIAVPTSPTDLARPIMPCQSSQLPSPPPTPPYRNIPIPQRLPPAPPVSSIPRALRCIDGKVLRSPIDLDRAATVRPV